MASTANTIGSLQASSWTGLSSADAPPVSSTQNGAVGPDIHSRVLRALENPSFVWRTVDGIAQESHLSEAAIAYVLKGMPSDVLVTTPSRKGQLYTTRSHYAAHRSLRSRLLSVLTDMPK